MIWEEVGRCQLLCQFTVLNCVALLPLTAVFNFTSSLPVESVYSDLNLHFYSKSNPTAVPVQVCQNRCILPGSKSVKAVKGQGLQEY